MDFYQISIGVLFCFIEAIYDCLKFVAGSSFGFSNEISIQSFESLEGLQQLAQDYLVRFSFSLFHSFYSHGQKESKNVRLHASENHLGGSWRLSGASWGAPGVLLGGPGGLLGASWGVPGPPGGVLGRSWGHLLRI